VLSARGPACYRLEGQSANATVVKGPQTQTLHACAHGRRQDLEGNKEGVEGLHDRIWVLRAREYDCDARARRCTQAQTKASAKIKQGVRIMTSSRAWHTRIPGACLDTACAVQAPECQTRERQTPECQAPTLHCTRHLRFILRWRSRAGTGVLERPLPV